MLLQMALFHSFLWLSIYVCVCIDTHTHTHYISFIQSPADGYLGCFHVLAIVNSATVNIQVHASFQIMAFFRYMSRCGIDPAIFLVS